MKELSHIDTDGHASMVDVSAKKSTLRSATAQARVMLSPEILKALDGDELRMPKGPVFQTAIIAGIMAAKKTGELIPLCHPLQLDNVQLDIKMEGNEAVVNCTARIHGKTGVEMEALTGVSLAALTIYDMCKALSHSITIREIRLMEKTGGKNDFRIDR